MELDRSKRRPVGGHALQCNLSVKVPEACLVLGRPLKSVLAALPGWVSESGRFLESWLPLTESERIFNRQLLFHPHGLVLGKELLLHFSLGFHEGLNLLLYKVVKFSLLTLERGPVIDLALDQFLELGNICTETGAVLVMVRLNRR